MPNGSLNKKIEKYKKWLPEDPIQSIRSTHQKYAILTESGKLYLRDPVVDSGSPDAENQEEFKHISRPNEDTEKILHWDLGLKSLIYTTVSGK
jgi:hypothetical protein